MFGILVNFVIPFVLTFDLSVRAYLTLGVFVVILQLTATIIFLDAIRRIRSVVLQSNNFQMVNKTVYLLVGLIVMTITIIIISSCIPASVVVVESFVIDA